MAGDLNVRNVGTTPCELTGAPAGVTLFSDDTPLDQVDYRAMSGTAGGESIADSLVVAPGGQASAAIVWSNWCPEMIPLVTRVAVTFAQDGGTLDADPPPHPKGIVGPAPGFGSTPRCDDPASPSTLVVTPFSPIAADGP